MSTSSDHPEDFGHMAHEIRVLQDQIKKQDLQSMRLAAARIHLDILESVLPHFYKLDEAVGSQLSKRNTTSKTNFGQLAAGLRLLREASNIILAQITGYLNCFGGTTVIGIQMLEKWAEENETRRAFLLEYLAASTARRRRAQTIRKPSVHPDL